MQDELVQVLDLLVEARLAIAALLGCAELVLEKGVVLGADDGEVVAHGGAVVRIAWALVSSLWPFAEVCRDGSDRQWGLVESPTIAALEVGLPGQQMIRSTSSDGCGWPVALP